LKVQPQGVTENDLLEGYRETELGLLPDTWKLVQLGDVATVKYGKAKPKAHGDIPTVGSGGVYSWTSTALVEFPTLIVGRKGTAGKVWLQEQPSWPSDTTFYLEWKSDQVDHRLVYHSLQARPLSGEHSKTTLPSLSKPDVEQYLLPLPPRSEQRAIAHVLRTVQEAKEATEKVIEATWELKRSLMNHLFTYGSVPVDEAERVPLKETEIGSVPDHWEVVKLGDVCERFQYGTSERCTIDGPGAPVLRIPNVIGGDIDTHDLKYAELPEKTADKLKLSVGDVLFVRTNGRREYVGRCAVFQGEPVGALFASYLIRAQLEKDLVLPAFLQSYTETTAGRQWLSGRASEAADGKYNLNTQILKDVSLPLPSLVEQDQLTSNLEGVDAKIAVETNRKRTLEVLFKTLLHNLMTGKVRVTDLDLSKAGELV
jgi:type I restriction enzyme S subunit